jgi:hypothetical protein
VRIDHRTADITVAKQFLNGANVMAGLEKMSGKRMPQRIMIVLRTQAVLAQRGRLVGAETATV